MKTASQVVLDCERMKYPNTGLYHYCLQLAQALQRNINKDNEQLKLYVRRQTEADFGKGFSFIPQHSLHKFFMPLKKEYDVWHATYQGTNYFPFQKKIPTVLTIHDLNFLYDEHKASEKKEKYLKQLAKKIKHSDHIVTISNFVLDDVKQHFDLEKKTCSVIYNGCNISDDIIPAIAESKKPAASFFYTIGTIVDKKNFHVLPPLLANNDKLLIISGVTNSQPYKEKIINEAIKYNVENRVIFTGPITETEKYWYLKNCEAFLFPSIAEGFGLPVIEAMHFGKPVILSTHTSLPEIGGNEAYYFTDFEPENMRQTLKTSMDHYNTTNPEGKIRARADFFNWDVASNQYLQVYRSLF